MRGGYGDREVGVLVLLIIAVVCIAAAILVAMYADEIDGIGKHNEPTRLQRYDR